MKTTNKPTPQELIRQYSLEVGRYLPARDRDDIVKEIYSTLTDALEDKIGPSGGTEESIFVSEPQFEHLESPLDFAVPPLYAKLREKGLP